MSTQQAPLALEAEGICKKFGTLVANDEVNLKVKKGQIHALLGENGAGKSTLVNILFGLYKADQGEVRISGEKVDIEQSGLSKREWNELMTAFDLNDKLI